MVLYIVTILVELY